MEYFGRVRTHEPPNRFAFDWQADLGRYDLSCEIELEAIPAGTRVRLRETGFADSDDGLQDLLNRQGGWWQELTRLKAYAEHGIRV